MESSVGEQIRHLTYVKPENRITSELMSSFELAEVEAIRAKHMEMGHKPYIPIDIANIPGPLALKDVVEAEIKQKLCPFGIVRRFAGTNIAEFWSVNELSIKDR